MLDQQETGAGGEIQLTDAIQQLNQIQQVFANDFKVKGMILVKELDL